MRTVNNHYGLHTEQIPSLNNLKSPILMTASTKEHKHNAEKAVKIQQDGSETEKDHFAIIEVW